MRIAPKLMVTAEQRMQLQTWAKGRRVPVRLAQRAQIVLLAPESRMDIEIAKQLGVGRCNRTRDLCSGAASHLAQGAHDQPAFGPARRGNLGF